MIQPQTLVQIYFVQTNLKLIHWLNKNKNNKNKSCGPRDILLHVSPFSLPHVSLFSTPNSIYLKKLTGKEN